MRKCMVLVACLAVPTVASADPCCEPPAAPVIGGTLTIGAQTRTLPPDMKSGSTGFVSPNAFTIDQTRTKSFWLAYGVERGNFVFMSDWTFGGASISGTTRALPDPPFNDTGSSTYNFTGTLLESTMTLRLGARQQVTGHLAIAAGAGIGGTLYVFPSSTVDRGSTTTGFGSNFGVNGPDGPSFEWFIPVWAQATYKTSCDWGVQLLAESDRHDWDDQRSTGISLGLAYQPDSACEIGH